MFRPIPCLLPLLLAAPLPLLGQDAALPSPPLTMERAVEVALAQNRRLQQGRLGVETARDREGQARSLAYPQVSGNGIGAHPLGPLDFRFPAGAFGTYPSTGPVPDVDTVVRASPGTFGMGSITVNQPLTQLIKIGQKSEIAGLSRQTEEEKLRGARQLVTQRVRKLCLDLLRTQSDLAAVAEAKAFLTELKSNVDQGVAAKTLLREESLTVDARLAETDTRERQLADLRITQSEQLNLLLGRTLDTAIAIAPSLAALPEEESLPAARTHALTARPEIRQARFELEQARLGVKAARNERLPEASLVVSQQWLGHLQPLPKSVGYAGIAVQWDIFNGGRKKAEVSVGLRSVQQAKLNVEEVEDQITIEVGTAYRALKLSQLALAGADLALAADKEKLRVMAESNKSDFASTRELLQQRASYEASHNRRQHAYYDTWLARAAFEQSLGLD